MSNHVQYNFDKDIHKRLMQLCKIANKSSYQLSEIAGMDPGTIARIIRYKQKPIRRTLARLCRAADVELRDFLEVDKA